MRKRAQEQPRFTAIDQHQFREREMRRQPNLMRFLPTADFVEETRQTMHIAEKICFRFARSQQRAELFRETQTVNRPQHLSPHLIWVPSPPGIDKSVRKSLPQFRVAPLFPY